MPKIVNIKNGPKGRFLYIGRANKHYNQEESIFHNPFIIGKDGTREEVIEKFRQYAPTNKLLMDSLYLIDKENFLGCYCDVDFGEKCHGQVLIELREKQKLEQSKNIKKYYSGVGSRSTPADILDTINTLAAKLARKNYILRSGGADGADSAFECGCDLANGKKEIYIPWKGFNNNFSSLYNISEEAMELAATIHPAWNKLTQGAKKLHARNCYQVLGQDLKTPSKVLICWTENGEEKGGTRTAIVLAKKHNIPVYNLAIQEHLDKLLKIING